MLIQVNTDNHIQGNERLTTYVKSVIEDSLSRFAERITRVEVHLHDTNSSAKGGEDKRCGIEVRVAGLDPVNVTDHAAEIDLAIDGAVDKMKTLLDRHLGKLDQTKGNVSFAGPQE